jgi:hypothetical protein
MNYEVCFIDDKILPKGGTVANETGLISRNEISGLISHDEWAEPTVKKFLTDTFDKADRYKQIQFSGFTHPNFFLNHIAGSTYRPNSIILDWDYGDSKAEEKIEEIINLTQSKIFILTGNELESDVEAIVSPIRKRHVSRGLGIFSKTIYKEDNNTQKDLIQALLSDLESMAEEIKYHDINAKFYPSSFLPTYDRFWMVESIVSSGFIKEFLKKNAAVISHQSVVKMFEESKIKFYINSKNTRIYSENGTGLAGFYKDNDSLNYITPIYAIKNYELSILETAFEKGSSKTFQNHEERL